MDPSGHKFVEDNTANPCQIVGGCAAVINSGWSEIDHIDYQAIAQNARENVRNAAPDLYLEGVNGQITVVTGGVECVYDFDTNEIGYFSYSGVYIGDDLAGGGAAAYAGVGYKGIWQGKPLKNAYRGGSTSVNGEVTLPYDLSSLTLGSSVSSSPSEAGLPTPHFEQVKTFTIQAGAGLSASPLPGSFSATHTNYTYRVGHSFGSDAEMIRFIWQSSGAVPQRALMLTALVILN